MIIVTFCCGGIAVGMISVMRVSMEERMNRGPGGRLALWVFYAFCGYFVWAMVRYVWVISAVETIPGATIDGEIGSTSGKWLGAILGFLLLSIVGALLGGIAWYTRPRPPENEERS